VIAVDTNVLVHAHRAELPRHRRALEWIVRLSEGGDPWALPVFCLGEFIRVVTHPKLFDPPSGLDVALESLAGLRASPSLVLLSPGPRYPALLDEAARKADARGNLAFDAQIAAVCREHGVGRILTEDRDFARFPGVRTITLDDDLPPT